MGIYFYLTIAMLILSVLILIFGWKGKKTVNNILILIILSLQFLILLNVIKPIGDLHRGSTTMILTAFITPMSIYSYSDKTKALSIILFIVAFFYLILSSGILHIEIGR